jgi:hypothetical protein
VGTFLSIMPRRQLANVSSIPRAVQFKRVGSELTERQAAYAPHKHTETQEHPATEGYKGLPLLGRNGMVELEPEAAEKTYRAIGRFVFEFSQTEYTIRHFLGEEVNLAKQYFFAVIQSYDVGLLCNVTKQVIKISMDASRAAEIEKLINQFLKLNEERTRVAHGVWVPYFQGGMVQHVSRSSLQPKMHSGQAELLERHADQLSLIRGQLNRVFTVQQFSVSTSSPSFSS